MGCETQWCSLNVVGFIYSENYKAPFFSANPPYFYPQGAATHSKPHKAEEFLFKVPNLIKMSSSFVFPLGSLGKMW